MLLSDEGVYMFLFNHSKQNNANASYYKGILFEELLQTFLEKLGYSVELRKKHNSLEYDIEGIDKATERKILGEAKAIDKNVSGAIFSSFVGKILPLGLMDKSINGLFLSTSSLTSEAEEYYKSIKNMGVKSISGKDLYKNIVDIFNLPNKELLESKVITNDLQTLQHFILKTDSGLFLALVFGAKDSVAPSYFAIFNSKAENITDRAFLQKLQETVSEFSALKPLDVNVEEEIKSDSRSIPSTLAVSTSWLDYRLPAGPRFYIGREDFISEIMTNIINGSDSNIIQLKSRSGVGKSSTLSMINQELQHKGVLTEIHDSRDIKSVLDFRAVIRRFVNSNVTPQDMRDVDYMLKSFSESLGKNKAVFMVDQFESTFQKPEIFESYEMLATLFMNYKGRLYFILARKNDQLTTYDDNKISLDKFNAISEHFELKDFSKKEAALLIDNINSSTPNAVSREVLSYVLEFAQGFPWLLKRTMAHIVNLLSKHAVTHNELFASGLKLDDLFEEELEGLDEIEKEYLYKIAARLPSDYHQLQRAFDEDPLLPKILDKLTQSRLLRMTGATYDTYNDVFKEYLVYRKLPDFRQAIIYRKHPNSVLAAFVKIFGDELLSTDELMSNLSMSRGGVFNYIKEWRNVSIIEKVDDGWIVPKKVIEAYKNNSFGDYLRRQVMDNDLVAKVINHVTQGKLVESYDIVQFVKEQFPFVEATDKTWGLYANNLKAWLECLYICKIDKNGRINLVSMSRDEISNRIKNIDLDASNGRSAYGLFLPSVTWKHVENCVKDILEGKTAFDGEKAKAIADLKHGEWYIADELIFNDLDGFKQEIKEMLTSEVYRPIWESVKRDEPLLTLIKSILTTEYSDVTLVWRLRKLTNWGKAFGIIENKRVKYK